MWFEGVFYLCVVCEVEGVGEGGGGGGWVMVGSSFLVV